MRTLRWDRAWCSLVSAAAVTSGSADEWDVGGDWSDTENPNGPWSYNDGDTPIPVHWDSWHDTGSPGWAWSLYGVPSWVRHSTAEGCWDVLDGQVYTHGDKGSTRGNVTWVAPSTGLFAVRGGTWWIHNDCPPSDHSGRAMDWRFLVNGELAQSGNIGDGDSYSSAAPARFGGIMCLEEGDVLRIEYQRTTAHSTIAVLDWHIELPPTCRPDLDVSNAVDVGDLLVLLAAWGDGGAPCIVPDLDDDGTVAVGDLLVLLAAWGPCK